MDDSLLQIRRGDRFAFGRNWNSFVDLVDEGRIHSAAASLRTALGVEDLGGRTFLDVGCGSGLFSLAAHRLGARVHSFDFDAEAVRSALRLRRAFAPDAAWTIEQGSILDDGYRARLGTYDLVYAWGVLHHTGAMWRAFDAAVELVAPGGLLYVALYNDQGRQSRMWTAVKRRYNRSGAVVRGALVVGSSAYVYRAWPLFAVRRLLTGGSRPAAARARGMSRRHDMLDWVGGYPFEVSRPEQVIARAHAHDLSLLHLKTCGGGLGCNEYVLRRPGGSAGGQERAEPADDLAHLGGTRAQLSQGHPR
ncbi:MULTISPECIES: class I SAM-dependent methyltransferase [Streptosporangium]|uniref:2-polyprenyl-6-hydroxyphenyl methylase/3-demethylubiquinone-9 3-methyltransferase n=1 Tax=Streptosporangium brasiliense TaxID=47480 RepID=A0ABT9RF66_9ACTN|nr:class I SAM-dependent methyltransferase [Streptosporangium brasiliense]MDP9867913.1 2-polyprenyl-6-hydroxyphenyl methylase/3-demethylubiquinone-9 3-methyltransferase [Streptosporangium brasiliense]